MRFAATCAVLAVVLLPFRSHAAVVVQTNEDNHLSPQDDAPRAGRSDEPSATGNWAMASRIAMECAKDADAVVCLAVKAAAALERAARLDGDVQVLPGLTVTKNAGGGDAAQRDSRSLPTEDELRDRLQHEPADGSSKALDMVVNSALRFLQSRTLTFNFPQTNTEELSRAVEEGRGKLKKKMLPILGLLAVKIVAVLPFVLGVIGFFALKALVLGKLALLIAGILAFQKFSGSSAGLGKFTESWGTANQAVPWSAPAAPGTNGGYYRRSMEAAAQQMAYNGQMQPSVVQNAA